MQIKQKEKLAGYSLIELLVTIAIFGVLSAMLGQSLLTNLTLSARVSARSQMRSGIDQTMSLIERDFRNADYLSSVASSIPNASPVPMCGVSYFGNTGFFSATFSNCSSLCSMEINSKTVTWCFNDFAVKGKLVRYEDELITYESAQILDITRLDFNVNNSQSNQFKNLTYANILVTLQAQNAGMKIYDQVKQISITTKNYPIK